MLGYKIQPSSANIILAHHLFLSLFTLSSTCFGHVSSDGVPSVTSRSPLNMRSCFVRWCSPALDGIYVGKHGGLPLRPFELPDENIIDLGLSLKMLNAQNNNPSHFAGGYGFGCIMEAPNLMKPDMAYHNTRRKQEDADEEGAEVQSKERYAYLKVNMDGVLVGRKICIPDHSGYASLALTLEDMFGWQSFSGLHLFQEGSNYALYYKDTEGNWRSAGDVPWREFMESVRRLRIVNVTFDDAGNS